METMLLLEKPRQTHKEFMTSFWQSINAKTDKRKERDKDTRRSSIKFDLLFQDYINEIEYACGHKLPDKQIAEIKYHIEHYIYNKLSTTENKQHRREFNGAKHNIIQEFENQYGRPWKTYDENVKNKHGKIIRMKGQKYDAHHIIPCSYGGNNEWWNMIDLKHPSEHQDYIHRKGGAYDKMFGK